MTGKIAGIHHVTAIAGEPQRNLDFYTGVLGLILVMLTVNNDDPATYHFYFGEAEGRPGTILTFFPRPGAPWGRGGPSLPSLRPARQSGGGDHAPPRTPSPQFGREIQLLPRTPVSGNLFALGIVSRVG